MTIAYQKSGNSWSSQNDSRWRLTTGFGVAVMTLNHRNIGMVIAGIDRGHKNIGAIGPYASLAI